MHAIALHTVVAGLRRAWLVPLVAVATCAVFAAHPAGALIAASHLDSSSPRLVALPTVQPATPPRPDAGMLVERNMFCSTCAPSHEPSSTSSFRPDAILIATSIGFDARATLRVLATEVQG